MSETMQPTYRSMKAQSGLEVELHAFREGDIVEGITVKSKLPQLNIDHYKNSERNVTTNTYFLDRQWGWVDVCGIPIPRIDASLAPQSLRSIRNKLIEQLVILVTLSNESLCTT